MSDAVDSERSLYKYRTFIKTDVFRTLSNISGQERGRLVELWYFDKDFV